MENKGVLIPNKENGYDYENYRWTQRAKEVSIYIPLNSNIKSKNIKVKFFPNRIQVEIENSDLSLDGELYSLIKAEDSTWLISDNELVIELEKKKFDEWWTCLLKGQPELDASKIAPPQGNISDLDDVTRATIDKMMYEQEIKEKNGFYK